MDSNYIGIDQSDFNPPEGCPEWCRGELRETCMGCDYYEEEDE